jgi:hypothetical protein
MRQDGPVEFRLPVEPGRDGKPGWHSRCQMIRSGYQPPLCFTLPERCPCVMKFMQMLGTASVASGIAVGAAVEHPPFRMGKRKGVRLGLPSVPAAGTFVKRRRTEQVIQ